MTRGNRHRKPSGRYVPRISGDMGFAPTRAVERWKGGYYCWTLGFAPMRAVESKDLWREVGLLGFAPTRAVNCSTWNNASRSLEFAGLPGLFKKKEPWNNQASRSCVILFG